MFQCTEMKKASIRDLRHCFGKIERMLQHGEENKITKRQRVIARLIPASAQPPIRMPDFLARLRNIYGDKKLKVSGAKLIARDRDR